MTPRARRIVRASGIGAAAIAAILSPIPLADEFVLAPGLLGVAALVGRDRGLRLVEMPWRNLAAAAVASVGARAALIVVVGSIPVVGAVANAVTAYTLTRGYAEWADRACAGVTAGSPASA